jgi:uncharacterized protein DUF4019
MLAQRTHALLAVLLSSVCGVNAQPPSERPAPDSSTIGYPTVQTALEALQKKAGVTFRTQDGWLIAQDDEDRAVYLFTPREHPAYPTVIKRSVFNRDGSAHIGTDALCEAGEAVCDALMVSVGVRAPDVDVKPLGDDRYELTLTSPTVLEVEAAQQQLLPTALEACGRLTPLFGRYRFDSERPVAGAGQRTASFTLVQEVQCAATARPPVDAGRATPTLGSEAEADEVRAKVSAMSIEYFEDIANQRYAEAYAAVDDILRADSTPESWAEEARSFRSAAGGAVSLKIRRLTIYDNPPGAPEPGLYVAADFDNVWEDAPLHCGYLVWFRRGADTFRITRQETGHMTSEQWKTMSTDDVRAIRRQWHCVDE